MNGFSGRWVYPLREPRNMGPQSLQAQNWWVARSAFLPACHPEPDSGTKVCSALLLPSHPSPSQSAPFPSFILSSSACSHPASSLERPACPPPTLSGESSSKASLLSSLQNLPLPGTPDPPKCLLVLTSDASKPSARPANTHNPSHLTWSKRAYHLISGEKNLMSHLSEIKPTSWMKWGRKRGSITGQLRKGLLRDQKGSLAPEDGRSSFAASLSPAQRQSGVF